MNRWIIMYQLKLHRLKVEIVTIIVTIIVAIVAAITITKLGLP